MKVSAKNYAAISQKHQLIDLRNNDKQLAQYIQYNRAEYCYIQGKDVARLRNPLLKPGSWIRAYVSHTSHSESALPFQTVTANGKPVAHYLQHNVEQICFLETDVLAVFKNENLGILSITCSIERLKKLRNKACENAYSTPLLRIWAKMD